MRHLATIQKIESINPIENADNIEVARVKGWNVVTRKGEFTIGDVCIYCEIDSFLPIKPEFEFLRKTSYKKMGEIEGFRLKSIRLRNTISQGLLLRPEVLPEGSFYYISDDVTELLGIVKYEPPIPAELAGVMKGQFPSFIARTDEERCQNLSAEYETLKTGQYSVTEKLDGSSATFYVRNGEFGVCSRNLELLESEGNPFWKVARGLKIEEFIKERFPNQNVALQGELLGPGIQGNKYQMTRHSVRFFNGIDIDTRRRWINEELQSVLEGSNLEMVPLIDEGLHTLPDTIDELIARADGTSIFNLKIVTPREGLVFRDVNNPKISFKVISNKFLIRDKS